MWVCSVFDDPGRFLDPEVRCGRDVAGVLRWFFAAFEGDDSGVQTSPQMIMVSESDRDALRKGSKSATDVAYGRPNITPDVVKTSALALDFWERAGFNMKFVFATKRATIVGVHIELSNVEGNTEPTGLFAPELPRGIMKNISVSAAILQAVEKQSLKEVKQIAAAANLAKAADYAGILPTVSRKYKEYADRLDSSDYSDREMAMRVAGEEGVTASTLRADIELQNGQVTPAEEEDNLKRLGYFADETELANFNGYLWDLSTCHDHQGYFNSLPKAWRAGGSM
jgi:hypothetical protein